MEGLPRVKQCDVTECCFNREKMCHAAAILVGDEIPVCDTFTSGMQNCGIADAIANVGACKTTGCAFNRNLECIAPGITVGHQGDRAECQTYKHR